ncbi:MAG: hypothetical protein HYR85_25735 [Planctomycetes bacterium]|nr:hypothetical protein [Planctomycetota bacterium]MBI3847717.1 hypothetical protein [Planctomycetota bacterium]
MARWLTSVFAVVLVLSVRAVAGETVKHGKWRIGDEPKTWNLYSTEHYQVQSHIPKERAKIVTDHLERMQIEYAKRFPIRKPLKDMVVKIFANRAEYLAYPSPEGSAAYYSPKDHELVCYDTGFVTGREAPPDIPKDRQLGERLKKLGVPEDEVAGVEDALLKLSNMSLLGVLSHEGWHQYFHFYIVSEIPFPSWLDEGMGDYFFSAKPAPDGKSMVFGDLMPIRFSVIWGALKTNKFVPVKELIRYRQPDYYENASVCYAEGWSLVYFCYQSGNERYAKIPDTLIHVFKDKHDMDEATNEAFAHIDLAKFEAEWKAFYLNRDFVQTIKDLAYPAATSGAGSPH